MYIIILKDDNTIIDKTKEKIIEFSNNNDPIISGICYPLNLIDYIEIEDEYYDMLIPYKYKYEKQEIIPIQDKNEEELIEEKKEEIIKDES